MIPIEYVVGDATDPQGDGVKLIIHIVNNRGGWGRGFVNAISKRWDGPERVYRADHKHGHLNLGTLTEVLVAYNTFVINMVAQDGYSTPGSPAIRYDALADCLERVGEVAVGLKASVHAPRIGTGLAGGKWEIIEPILIHQLSEKNVKVTIYDLP